MTQGNTPNIQFFNLNSVNQEPVVSQRIQRNRDYVFFGKHNLFPQELVNYYDNINVHRQLINKISLFIAGKGFEFDGPGAEQAQAFINEATSNQPKKFLKKLSSDMYTFNGGYINTLYNLEGKISTLSFTDFTSVRCGKFDANKVRGNYWHSSNWKIATTKLHFNERDIIHKPVEIARYNPATFNDSLSKENGQLFLIEDCVGKNGKIFYPEPSYMAVINWLKISAMIADLHKNNLANGMVGTTHIHLYEDLSDKGKRDAVEGGINDKFAGSNNAGTILVTWSTTSGKEPKITALPTNNSHEMGKFLQDASNEEIVKSHDVPNILSNQDTTVGLGGDASAITRAMQQFQATVIQPRQDMITETIDMFLEVNEINATTKIKSLNPFEFLGSEAIITLAMTVDEIREKILNLEPIAGGDIPGLAPKPE